jgi:hypothetical protein
VVRVTLTIEDEVLEVLQTLAEMGNTTIEEVLRDMVIEDLQRIKERINDPLVGALGEFGGAESDVASRVDDIIRDEWQPD